jgi:hypothetical protein
VLSALRIPLFDREAKTSNLACPVSGTLPLHLVYAAIRFSVEGCVENSLRSAVPESGCMMYMWDIEGDACRGICFPTESSFSSALIIGCAVPNVRADVASALNSRVLEIAIRIKPAAIGASKIIS